MSAMPRGRYVSTQGRPMDRECAAAAEEEEEEKAAAAEEEPAATAPPSSPSSSMALLSNAGLAADILAHARV